MRGWVTFAVLAVAAAGCSSSADSESTPEGGLSSEDINSAVGDVDVEASSTTGVIRGVVVDSGIRPIAGATVEVAGNGKVTTSNEQGAFGFDGLEPGTYFLSAGKDGYYTSQTSVDVEAGDPEPTAIKIRLEPKPFSNPYCNVQQQRGSVGIAVTDPRGDRLTVFNPINPADTSFYASADLDANLTWTQTEVVWEPNFPTADRFWVDFGLWTDDDAVDTFTIEGASPIIALFDPAQIAENAEPLLSDLVVWAGRMEPQPGVYGPGFMLDQLYTAYFISCYHWAPALGYSFYLNGEPKPPQTQPPPSGAPPP